MSALVETRSLRMRETGGANSQNHCHCAPLVIQLVTCGLKGPTKPSWSDPASEVIVSWSSCLQSPVGGRRRDHVVHRAPKLTRRAGPPLFDLSQGTFALCLLWTRRVPAAQLPELPGFDQSAGHGYGPSGGFGLVDVTKTARRTSVPERTFFGEEVGKRFLQCLALLSEPGSQSQSERKHVRSDVAAAWRWRSPAGLPRSEFDVRRCSCRPHQVEHACIDVTLPCPDQAVCFHAAVCQLPSGSRTAATGTHFNVLPRSASKSCSMQESPRFEVVDMALHEYWGLLALLLRGGRTIVWVAEIPELLGRTGVFPLAGELWQLAHCDSTRSTFRGPVRALTRDAIACLKVTRAAESMLRVAVAERC